MSSLAAFSAILAEDEDKIRRFVSFGGVLQANEVWVQATIEDRQILLICIYYRH